MFRKMSKKQNKTFPVKKTFVFSSTQKGIDLFHNGDQIKCSFVFNNANKTF